MAKVSFCAVGDIGIQRDKPESLLAGVAPYLSQADIAFCQVEQVFSERFEKTTPGTGVGQYRTSPKFVSALTSAGFDVASFASNHALAWGVEGMMDTIDVLERNGIAVIGAGKNLEEARRPAILARSGVRFGILAYCCVAKTKEEATLNRPGVNPVRVWTIYQPLEEQPGTLSVKAMTFPDFDHLEAMEEDIAKARGIADVVIVSMHWGMHFQRAVLATYQRWLGHAAISAGADLIIGHHPHILKGMEVYKGKVIAYSMGNFAMEFTSYEHELHRRENLPGRKHIMERYGWDLDPEYTGYAYPRDSRKSIIVRAAVENKKIARVSYLPVYINRNAEPEIVLRQDPRFEEVASYMKDITESQGLNARYQIDGDDVFVVT